MKNLCLISIIAILLSVSAPILSEAAINPFFGGQVIVTLPCNNGLLLYVLTSTGVENLLWTYGELPYLTYTPPHPGQYILGMSSLISTSCTLGPYTIGQGYPILYHGEGI